MNFSLNLTRFNATTYQSAIDSGQEVKINIMDIIGGVCNQLDSRIIIFCLLIFTFYILKNLILPLAREGIKGLPTEKLLNSIYDYFESVTDTIQVFSAGTLLYFGWLQGVEWWFYVWVGVLVFLCVLVRIKEVWEWIRKRFGSK